MAHPQSSPRGLFAKDKVSVDSDIGAHSPVSSLPGDVDFGSGLRFGKNSTGHFVAVNSTGTNWKYLNVTSKQPT